MIISKVMPLRSAAGWYAGRCYVCNKEMPGSEQNHHNFKDGDLVMGWPYERCSDYFTHKENLLLAMDAMFDPDEMRTDVEYKYC